MLAVASGQSSHPQVGLPSAPQRKAILSAYLARHDREVGVDIHNESTGYCTKAPLPFIAYLA